MIVLIVMIISVALLLALLSGFLPFVNMYGNVTQYTTAYYGALSAIERGALAVRYSGPGFDGVSGRKTQNGEQPVNTGKTVDEKLPNFYTYGDGRDSLLWTVKSSTDRIPSLGEGNIDPAFITQQFPESRNFNMLGYAKTELIPLGTVGSISPNDYYTNKKAFQLHDAGVNFALEGEFRLNPFLYASFSGGRDESKLCTSNCPGSPAEDWRDNDQVVATWMIKGKYGEGQNAEEFSLLPKDGTNLNQGIIAAWDTLIRKKEINQGPITAPETPKKMTFGENRHPFYLEAQDPLNIISNVESQLQNLQTYSRILTSEKVSNAFLSFSLVNFLWSKKINLYPFLEYSFHTRNGERIADRFYTIQGEAKVGTYNVKLQVKKPTLAQPALGNFTIIF